MRRQIVIGHRAGLLAGFQSPVPKEITWDVDALSTLLELGQSDGYKTADGPLTGDLMAMAYEAFHLEPDRGLTSLDLAAILDIQDPGHANYRWRPGSDRRVNEILKKFKKKGLIEYHKFPDGWKWRPKEAK